MRLIERGLDRWVPSLLSTHLTLCPLIRRPNLRLARWSQRHDTADFHYGLLTRYRLLSVNKAPAAVSSRGLPPVSGSAARPRSERWGRRTRWVARYGQAY